MVYPDWQDPSPWNGIYEHEWEKCSGLSQLRSQFQIETRIQQTVESNTLKSGQFGKEKSASELKLTGQTGSKAALSGNEINSINEQLCSQHQKNKSTLKTRPNSWKTPSHEMEIHLKGEKLNAEFY